MPTVIGALPRMGSPGGRARHRAAVYLEPLLPARALPGVLGSLWAAMSVGPAGVTHPSASHRAWVALSG
ncbi:MAG: hypothetical protein M3256_25110 [Actinomycetota bacterium]|nr:hypothetical protein [Actinomycetota bacterium]